MLRIPALDGLRALAVGAVMLFHLQVPGFALGWAGVPLFFVLSGYLITGKLIAARGPAPDPALGPYLFTFYWRRTVRIFPLYYFYLLVNGLLCLGFGVSLAGYGWFAAFLGNQFIGAHAPDVTGGYVGHLWSLAVEEQFYLAWPFLVFALAPARLRWLAVVMIVAAPLVRQLLVTTGNPYLAIVTLPSCMDMLAAGALVALTGDRRLGLAMAVAGTAITAWCLTTTPYAAYWLTPEWVPQGHILFTGLALVFAPLLRLAPAIPGLAARPLVYAGTISYGLYIWHPLVFAAVHKAHLPPVADAVLGLALAFGVASASWHLFENVILKLKDRYPVRAGTVIKVR